MTRLIHSHDLVEYYTIEAIDLPTFAQHSVYTHTLGLSNKDQSSSREVTVTTINMPPVTLPPSFYNSFWSPDYRSGLDVLFKNLEQVGQYRRSDGKLTGRDAWRMMMF